MIAADAQRGDRAARMLRSRKVMAELRARRAALRQEPLVFTPSDAPLAMNHFPCATSRKAVKAAKRKDDIRAFFETRVDRKPDPTDPAMLLDWCDDCGCRHDKETRIGRLRRLAPDSDLSLERIREDLGACMWPQTDAGDRMLFRDLHEVFGPATAWSRHGSC